MTNLTISINTSAGKITAELYPQQAPQTVQNFLQYVNSGFYSGTIFHRVIAGFMIQGGGLDANLQPKPTKAPVVNEARPDVPNTKFTLAMARTADPHSATAQFFINVADNHFLNQPETDGWGYAVFGKVIAGQDVVLEISKTETTSAAGYTEVPFETITINDVEVIS